LHDTVGVNEKVGAGKVRITLSFEDWKDGKVAPATYEVDQPPPDDRKRPADDLDPRLPRGTGIGE